jgi:hypothetical protein
VSSIAGETEKRPVGRAPVLPKLAISLALGALFAWLVNRGGVPLIPPASAFGRVAWWTVGAYALVLLATHFFRASRWRFLIRPEGRHPVPRRRLAQ